MTIVRLFCVAPIRDSTYRQGHGQSLKAPSEGHPVAYPVASGQPFASLKITSLLVSPGDQRFSGGEHVKLWQLGHGQPQTKQELGEPRMRHLAIYEADALYRCCPPSPREAPAGGRHWLVRAWPAPSAGFAARHAAVSW